MKTFIPLWAHAILDVIGGVLITALPWITGAYKYGGAAIFLPVVFGSMQLVMAFFSQHQVGIVKVFPMQLHLFLDMVVGVILIMAPFIYHFYVMTWWPYVLMGLVSLSAGLFTAHSPFLHPIDVFDERGR